MKPIRTIPTVCTLSTACSVCTTSIVYTVCTLCIVCTVHIVRKHNIRYTTPISLLLPKQSIHLQIRKKRGRHTSVPSAARSTDCVHIASGSVLSVAQWTWYVHVVCGSGQTERASGKIRLERRDVFFMVHIMLLRLPNEGKGDG
jgi:hypothetical protein